MEGKLNVAEWHNYVIQSPFSTFQLTFSVLVVDITGNEMRLA